jgi:hypothetical protein
MSKTLNLLRDLILVDSDGDRTRIVSVEGAEKGHKGLVIYTQSKQNREDNIRNKVTVTFSEE